MQGRSDVEIEIYGMEGIPEKDQQEHAKKMRDGGPKSKRSKNDSSSEDSSDDDTSTNQFIPGAMGFPGMGMPGMGMPGMMPGGPMGMNMMGAMGMPMRGMGMPMGPMGMNNPNMRWPMPPNQSMMGPRPMGPGPMGPGPMPPRPMGPGPPGANPIRPPGAPIGPGNPGGDGPEQGVQQGPTQPFSSGNEGSNLGDDRNAASSMPKPLFPAASNISQSRPQGESGDGKSSSAAPKSLSGNSKLMHPGDEELSLEEIRSRAPKYFSPQKKTAPPMGSPPVRPHFQSRGTAY